MWIDEGDRQIRKAGRMEKARIFYRRHGLQIAGIAALGILVFGYFK